MSVSPILFLCDKLYYIPGKKSSTLLKARKDGRRSSRENTVNALCPVLGLARLGKLGKCGHTPHFCLRRFGALHVLASNASVATLAIFGRLDAAENACWGASPNPAFGTSCPKVLSASQRLAPLFLIRKFGVKRVLSKHGLVERISPNQGQGMILYCPPQNRPLNPLCRKGFRTANVNTSTPVKCVQPNPPALSQSWERGRLWRIYPPSRRWG